MAVIAKCELDFGRAYARRFATRHSVDRLTGPIGAGG